ncbi:MAG: PilZ domain-containing protein [Terriglobia bacterium]
MAEESRKRQTDRISLAIPIRVSGKSATGETFDVDSRTIVLSRDGASIILKQPLAPEQKVTIRHIPAKRESLFRVVGTIGGQSEGSVYGVAQVDPNPDFWGIAFPPMADSKRVVGRLLMECSVCQSRDVVYMNEIEVQVFQANQSLSRPCGTCAQSSVWRGVPSGLPDQQTAKPGADSAAPDGGVAPQPATIGRRRNTRVNTRLMACIRQAGFGDEVVMTENVSRGGLCFRSSKGYHTGTPIEVSVPYSPGGANIFIPARIAHVLKKADDEFSRVGVAYIQGDEVFRPR